MSTTQNISLQDDKAQTPVNCVNIDDDDDDDDDDMLAELAWVVEKDLSATSREFVHTVYVR